MYFRSKHSVSVATWLSRTPGLFWQSGLFHTPPQRTSLVTAGLKSSIRCGVKTVWSNMQPISLTTVMWYWWSEKPLPAAANRCMLAVVCVLVVRGTRLHLHCVQYFAFFKTCNITITQCQNKDTHTWLITCTLSSGIKACQGSQDLDDTQFSNEEWCDLVNNL